MYWNYVSCLLTIISTLLVGKRLWHGWMLAGLNSVIICFIGFQTKQWGFIPANLFCLAIYAHNIRKWRGTEAVAVVPAAEASGAATVKPIAISSATKVLHSKVPFREKARRFRKNGLAKTSKLRRFQATTSAKHRRYLSYKAMP